MLTPFEFNFFFSCIGFSMTAIYNFGITSDYTQILDVIDDPKFQAMLFLFSVIGASLSLSIACSVAIGGPLALNITGIIKDVFLTYAGFIFFDDTECTAFVMSGLAISFAGAIKTIIHKLQANNKTSKGIQDTKDEKTVDDPESPRSE